MAKQDDTIKWTKEDDFHGQFDAWGWRVDANVFLIGLVFVNWISSIAV